MAYIQTVLGVLDAAALGHSQIHEHVFVRFTPMAQQNPALCMDDFDRSLEELKVYHAAGGRFLVDAQPVAAGRDAEVLRALSLESSVAVTASTGYHLLGFYPSDCWIHALDEEALYQLYLSELKEGMLPWNEDSKQRPPRRTDIRAGLVKAAIPAEGAVGRYGILLRAATRAAVAGDVPLMLHTERGEGALDAITLCGALGLPPHRMVICHADRQAADFTAHEAIAATGAYLDYDTIARFKYHSDEDEVALILHMLEGGYGDCLLLALDTTAGRFSSYGGEIGLAHLLESFLPVLRRAGASDRAIERMTAGNCRRLFSGAET